MEGKCAEEDGKGVMGKERTEGRVRRDRKSKFKLGKDAGEVRKGEVYKERVKGDGENVAEKPERSGKQY